MKVTDILELADLYFRTKKDRDFDSREQELLRSIHKSLGRIIKGNSRAKKSQDIESLQEYYH